VIEYLRVENQVLREHAGERRLRFTDSQRRRLARAAKRVGRGALSGIGPVVTPDTLLRWHQRLVAKKYEGSAVRRPNGAWTTQVARQWTDAVDGFLRKTRYLIHDRDPVFTTRFRDTLRGASVECVRIPPRSPNLNAYAERFVRSIKSECLAQIVPLGERHLRKAVTEYTEHYHRERNHQGLDNRLIENPRDERARKGAVLCRRRLGGTLNYYYREAA
jgi:transposase InsO family protein